VGFWPPHLQTGDYDEVQTIEESTAREMARRLAREEGILAGTSTGLNVTAAVRLAPNWGLRRPLLPWRVRQRSKVSGR
jgi:cysteine synthase